LQIKRNDRQHSVTCEMEERIQYIDPGVTDYALRATSVKRLFSQHCAAAAIQLGALGPPSLFSSRTISMECVTWCFQSMSQNAF